jgi:hypothetical protein
MDLRINRLFYDTGKASYPCAMKRSATSRRLARFRPTSSERRAEQWPSTPRFVDEHQSRPARLLVVSMKEDGLSMALVRLWLGAAGGWWVASGAHVSIAPSGRGDLA